MADSEILERLARLEQDFSHVKNTLHAMMSKLDSVCEERASVELLKSKDVLTKEALSRAFVRIEILEKANSEQQGVIDRAIGTVEGVKKVASIIGSILGILGTAGIAKLFGVIS